jgi:hypothetical protein
VTLRVIRLALQSTGGDGPRVRDLSVASARPSKMPGCWSGRAPAGLERVHSFQVGAALHQQCNCALSENPARARTRRKRRGQTNAARGSPPTHQATRILALGEEGQPKGRAEDHWLRAETEMAGVNTGGRRRPPGRPAQAPLLRRRCRSDRASTSARRAPGPGASVGTDVRYAAAPAAFDVSEP